MGIEVRGRFAPSPTGDLHLGNARTALLAWLQVRSAGGEFVMRVEDLDRGRVRPGIMEAQLDDLRWLGLDWDEGPDLGGRFGPYLQSERQELYEAALAKLDSAGAVYQCICTRREIAEAASAPNSGDNEGPRYPGTCRVSPPHLSREPSGKSTAIRFRVRPGAVSFRDLIHGELSYCPDDEVGDFVVRRKDDVAAYQLAVTVDDAVMEITHVVRGADLLPSTARQILLYEALGLTPPAWIHVPLMLDSRGERMAKRYGAVSLGEVRETGVQPEQVVGWLASTCGLAEPGEVLPADDLIERFEVEGLPSKPTAYIPPPFLNF